MLDFRLPENRREGFIRYFVWQLRTWDCDTSLGVMKYIFDRMELNVEQKYYMCFLYANTYQVATAYAMWSEMPDIENIDLDTLAAWNTSNFKKLPYQTDCKWNKGHLDKMVASYMQIVNGRQKDFFQNICSDADPSVNYRNLNTKLREVFKIGRYCAWFWAQSLKVCCGLNIEPDNLLFGPESESHTNGMCYAIGKDEWVTSRYEGGITKVKQKIKYTPEMIRLLDTEAASILKEIKARFPDVSPDYFFMETSLCSYKKLFRTTKGRYLGYYHDRLLLDTANTAAHFPGVDYQIIHDFMREVIPSYCVEKKGFIDSKRMEVFYKTGSFPELELFPDLCTSIE